MSARFVKATMLCGVFCLALVFPAEAGDSASTAPPEKVIRDFYQWYVGVLVAERDPFTQEREELKRYVSERLIREIDDMIKGPDGLDGDYFVDAQDFDKEWAKNIKVAPPEIKGDQAAAEVTLTGSEIGVKHLQLVLARENGAWKIDRVTGK